MNERLKQIRLNKKLSQKEMATRLHLSQNHISAIEHGTRQVTDRLVDDVCREFNVNREWFVNGTGECFKNTLSSYPNLDSETRRLVEKFMQLDPTAQQHILGLMDQLTKE